ncbi:hypothetical protein P7H22_01615 [Paenibacillus larvae]|nr:hypothetical protein [Paenibacillus larvae]MDT2239359.1 hypothetical protein [Paenibacillus larvae]
MNANVRYYNGDSPVYNLVPTTNLVLGRQTIATRLDNSIKDRLV